MRARYPEDFEQHRSDPPLLAQTPSASHQSESASGPSGGLLSNVLSFVSREIGEFVVNATGGSESSTSQNVAGPSRERRGGTRQTEKRHRRQSAPTKPSHDIRVPKRAKTERVDKDTTSTRVRDVASHDERALEEDRLHTSLSPSPPSRRPRRGSISMPGSLFSRSPTPDSRTSPPDDRHVRFASDVVSPAPRQRHPIARSEVVEGKNKDEDEDERVSQSDEDYDGGPSSSPEREDSSFYPPLPSTPRRITAQRLSSSEASTPFRPPAIPSVKEVVARLDGDSPPQLERLTKPTWNTPAKGKEKEKEKEKNPGHSAPFPSVNKDRSKEVVSPRLDSMSRLPSTAGSAEGARRVESFLRNKQVDLEADIMERSSRSSSKDDADKRRIRELEDMVKSLQTELAKSRSSFPLPPPPPPPPPPPISGSSTSRIPLSTPPRHGDEVDGVYASVRAGLRQTSNPSMKSKVMPKNRLPTVPADKMEAFLNELKTVRLRKVGSGESLNRDSSRDRSQSSSQGNASLPEIGDKRKRVDSGGEAQGALITSIRRRFNAPQPGTSVPSSSASGLSSRKSFLPPRHPHSVVNSIPSLLELHGPTPSICSDNSNEVDDCAPFTPPLGPTGNKLEGSDAAAANSTTSQPVEVPTLRDREAEIHDLHTHEIPEKPPPPRSTPQRMKVRRSPRARSSQSTQETVRSVNDDDDPFSRRLPTSPILPETPRRPRPPARVRSAAKLVPHSNSRSRSHSKSAPSNDASDYDPLSMTFSLPNDESTPAPEPIGRRRRRLTLDDELRKADTSYSYSEEERAVAELENGELVGVGQKSKQQGFLAHGGAGGDPVLMGVGYVAGAVEESQTDDTNEQKKEGVKGRKSRSSAGGKRRPKR